MYYIQRNTTQPEKKDKIIVFATTWMDLEGRMLNEISQTKSNMHDFTHTQKINIHRDKQNILVVTRGDGGWALSERVKGAHMHGDG